jgi:hypothetical protein
LRNSSLSRVNVNIVDPYTATEPIRFRRYTVKHLEDPTIVDLSISPYFYDLDLFTTSTDLVYSQWFWFFGDIYQLTLFVFIGDYPYDVARYRYDKFLELLPMSTSAIVNGDRTFLNNRRILFDTPIFVRFISGYPEFNKTVPYGLVRDYVDNRVEVITKKGV